nr:unnamed protein product [Callosobruchus analis]
MDGGIGQFKVKRPDQIDIIVEEIMMYAYELRVYAQKYPQKHSDRRLFEALQQKVVRQRPVTGNEENEFIVLGSLVDNPHSSHPTTSKGTEDKSSRFLPGKTLASYRDAAAVNKNQLIIKPKNGNEDNVNLEDELRRVLNPSELGVNIDNVRKTATDDLVINCDSAECLSKVKSNLENRSDVVRVQLPKKVNPKVCIIREEVEVNKNDLNKDEEVIVKELITRNNLEHFSNDLIIEVSKDVRDVLITKKYIYFGFKKCNLVDHHHVIRCFKCNKFEHMKGHCKNNITCFKCAESHTSPECKSTVKKL